MPSSALPISFSDSTIVAFSLAKSNAGRLTLFGPITATDPPHFLISSPQRTIFATSSLRFVGVGQVDRAVGRLQRQVHRLQLRVEAALLLPVFEDAAERFVAVIAERGDILDRAFRVGGLEAPRDAGVTDLQAPRALLRLQRQGRRRRRRMPRPAPIASVFVNCLRLRVTADSSVPFSGSANTT